MGDKSFDFYKAVSEELDPEKLQHKFLMALLDLQNVERGSIWVKSQGGYTCIEAAGLQSERIKGMSVSSDQPSIVGWVIENGKMTIAEAGKDLRHFKQAEDGIAVKSRLIVCFPLFLRTGQVYGAVQIIDTSAGGKRLNLEKPYLSLLQQLIDIGSIALSNSLVYSDQVKENIKLRETLDAIRSEKVVIGKSDAFLSVRKRAADYAATDFPVLITGESGTGKELLAKEIHSQSNRSGGPFLVQNCSCIPDTLLESELFGYQKGAFTGAVKSKIGLFEAANGGTIFLDEIGDMPLQLQARILRVIQENEIKPLGDIRTRKVDVRIISATNRDLRAAIVKEQFREDLFYRLNVLPLHIPSLRERPEDIALLLDHFLSMEAIRFGTARKTFAPDALDFLISYPWPGNVRELENFIKHILVITQAERITLVDLSNHFFTPPPSAGRGDRDQGSGGREQASGDRGRASMDREPESPPFSKGGQGGFSDIPEPSPRHSAAEDVPGSEQHHSKENAMDEKRPERGSVFEGYSWEQLEREYVLHLLDKHKWHITRAAKDAGVNRSTFDSRMKKLNIRK